VRHKATLITNVVKKGLITRILLIFHEIAKAKTKGILNKWKFLKTVLSSYHWRFDLSSKICV